jgi:hypothetical protein
MTWLRICLSSLIEFKIEIRRCNLLVEVQMGFLYCTSSVCPLLVGARAIFQQVFG